MTNNLERLHESNLNNEICRLCLTHEGEMSPIFSRPSDVKSTSIPYRIMAFTSIKLETGDGLPGLICHSCLFNVERVYEFKQQCEQSDAFLRKYFSSNCYSNVNIDRQKREKGYNGLHSNGIRRGNDVEMISINKEDRAGIDHNEDGVDNTEIDSSLFHAGKAKEEDSDGVIHSPLKHEKDGIESVVMIVDPSTKPLDASPSDNDDHDIIRKLSNDASELCNNQWSEMYHHGDDFEILKRQIEAQIGSLLHCLTCNKPFSDAQQLERHVMIHNQEPYFPCDYCESVFNDRAALKSHWRDHAGVSKLTCMTCGEAFGERVSYNQHIMIHDIIKPYHCPTCKRAFTNRSDLRKHTVIHSGVRPYVCDTCGKSFTRSTNLNKHARAHIGDRPYDCPMCNKKFSTRADLTRHSITHTGEKPYSCTICGLAFSRRDKLNRHVKLHEKNRPFHCGECSLSFNNKKVLAAHNQIHHNSIMADNDMDHKTTIAGSQCGSTQTISIAAQSTNEKKAMVGDGFSKELKSVEHTTTFHMNKVVMNSDSHFQETKQSS